MRRRRREEEEEEEGEEEGGTALEAREGALEIPGNRLAEALLATSRE